MAGVFVVRELLQDHLGDGSLLFNVLVEENAVF